MPVDFRSLVLLKSSRYPTFNNDQALDQKFGKTNYNKICLRLNDEFCEDICTTTPYGFEDDPDSDYIIFTKIQENIFKAELFFYYDEPHSYILLYHNTFSIYFIGIQILGITVVRSLEI